MPYIPKTDWEDLPSTATPVTAAELVRIETGIADVTEAVDNLPAPLEIGSGADQAAAGNHTHSGLTADAAAGTASVRTLGTGAQQAAAGNHTHATLVPTTRTVNGSALSANITLDGADLALTGYAIGTAAPVAATDTVNAAIAKLEARIVALEP